MLQIYQGLMRVSAPYLDFLLTKRAKQEKEDPERIDERKGRAKKPRPAGSLCWVHAASVGEAQSALILINALLHQSPDLNIMITTGTKTSAALMQKRLPKNAFHQFYPLDHPEWVAEFLDHWQPDLILWMESELWPNMLGAIKEREIPAALINARLSPSSYKRWLMFRKSATEILSAFDLILAQTAKEAFYFETLGGRNVHATDNLKYSAKPLDAHEGDLKLFNAHIADRPRWVFASTHKGEEELAARIHQTLSSKFPDLLTILVPRHPKRRDEILANLKPYNLDVLLRSADKNQPIPDTDIYIADTLGELGLFYRAAPVAVIGRSFSDDGGGGHNPIEAAKLRCAVLYGPNVQNLQDIFDEMEEHGASLMARDEQQLGEHIQMFLSSTEALENKQNIAFEFAHSKAQVIDTVMNYLKPYLEELLLLKGKAS